jgi:hypothetical protein
VTWFCSFAEWKPKTLCTAIEDAQYRSFSAAKATKESKDAFELFLKKEKEILSPIAIDCIVLLLAIAEAKIVLP